MKISYISMLLVITIARFISTRMPNDIAFTTHFICGGLAGTFDAIVTCPKRDFDNVGICTIAKERWSWTNGVEKEDKVDMQIK